MTQIPLIQSTISQMETGSLFMSQKKMKIIGHGKKKDLVEQI